MGASRTKQRRLERLQEDVDRILEGDARYFERHVDRSHRLRLAGQAEIRILEEMHGADQLRAAPGNRWYCVIRQVEPGARIRVYLQNEADLDTDIPDWQAGWLFDHMSPPESQVARAEASVRRVLDKWRAGL